MRAAILVVCLTWGIAQPATAERLWLVVGGSDSSPAGIAMKSQRLIQSVPQSFVIRTSDCGDTRDMYAVVVEAAGNPETAKAALSNVKSVVKDAYVKRCNVRHGSLLALRMTVVDPSIASVPSTAVNWQDEDRVSTAHSLPDGRTIVVVRYFVANPEDPLEGRRERVLMAESPEKHLVLKDDCIGAGGIAARQREVAFHCVKEQAGDHLIHTVFVFDESGKQLASIQKCRNPAWSKNGRVTCEEESVGPDGALVLHSKAVDVPH